MAETNTSYEAFKSMLQGIRQGVANEQKTKINNIDMMLQVMNFKRLKEQDELEKAKAQREAEAFRTDQEIKDVEYPKVTIPPVDVPVPQNFEEAGLKLSIPEETIRTKRESESTKPMFQRPVYQPMRNPNGEISYKLIGYEQANTPEGKYLPQPQQSMETPIPLETAKAFGTADTLNTGLSEIEDIINGDKVSLNELAANVKFNPTSYFQAEGTSRIVSRLNQMSARILNMLSGAAASEQEKKRINAMLFPKFGDTNAVYFDRIKIALRDVNNIIENASMTKKELSAKGKSIERNASQKTIVKTQTNKTTGQKRVVYSDGTTEIIQ